MEKIYIHQNVISAFILNPNHYQSNTPEGAILRTAYSDGIALKRVRAGWVEFCSNRQVWEVKKVCACW
ncbi:hypothetical protein AAEO70_001133 [Vibrio cholerae]